MCTDFHFDSEDEIAYTSHLVEERITFLESAIENFNIYNSLKDSLNSLKEAANRGCYNSDPHFPGEE